MYSRKDGKTPIRGILFLPKIVVFSLVAALLILQLANAQAQESPPRPSVTVSKAKIMEVVARVPVSGSLVPRDEVLVNSQNTGFEIREIRVDIGDVVKAGDLLATLNSRTLVVQLTQAEAEVTRANAAVSQAGNQIVSAKANLVQAAAALERALKLRESGNIAQSTLDQNIASEGAARAALSSTENGLAVAKAQLEQSKSQRDLAALNLERSSINAPVDGVISARLAKIGAVANAGGEPMFRIIRDGEIEMEAEVIETAFGSVSIGDKAELSIAGDGTVEGTVRLIAPTVDPVTRLGIVKVAIEENPSLRAGLYSGGWIITDRHQAITVPSTAVLSDATGTYVLAVENEILIRKDVVAGLIWENQRELIAGLEVGEVVVTKSGAFFVGGDLINPVFDTDPTQTGEAK